MMSKYKVVVEGKNPDYFIKQLIKNNIFIYEIKKEYKKLEIIISTEDFDKLKKIKTSYKYYVLDSYGVAKFKYFVKKYLFFLVCLGFGVGVIVLLSNVIFDVEVIHSNAYIREIIYNNLKEKGIYKYRFKVSFLEKEKIVDWILKKETNDIEWLEIEEVGTKYVVKVEQRKKNNVKDLCKNRNIVAKKDARLLEIQADVGEVVRKKNDYLKKGDIVISGVIHNKEVVVSKRCAVGKIFGEVWYKVNLEIPKEYREEKVTGREKKQLEINFLGKTFSIFNNFKTYKRNSRQLIGSNILPININFSKYLETNVKVYSYDISNIDNIALDLAISKLKNKLGGEAIILSKKVLKKSEKDSKIIVEVFIKVKEDITDFADIVDSEE